jgi:hypothetical protein
MDCTKTAEPEPISALSEGHDLVGVALFPLMPTDGNSVTAELFYTELNARLRADEIEAAGNGGLCGPGFIVWTTHTLDRNPLLRAVERAIKEMVLWEICEVTFFDKAEGYWRTIHPYGAPPFDRFFTPDNFKAAWERIGLEQEEAINAASDLRRTLRALRGNTE